MSEKIYAAAEWAKRAFIDDARIPRHVRARSPIPRRLLGRARQAHRLDQALHQGQEHAPSPAMSRSNGSRTAHSTSPTTASTGISPSAATRSRSSGKATIPHETEAHHLSRAARRGLPLRQCAEGPRRQEGRPRHHLHADDPGGGLRHAGLRPHRRDPFGGVRRLLARFARRPHRGLRLQRRHHRRRGPARRPQGSAQGQRRRGLRQGRRRRPRHRRAAHRRARSTWSRAATSITTRPPRP